MISRRVQDKGILAKFLEQGIKILVIKYCKKIGSIRIDIIASSIQIIKGELQKINIIAEDINYKDLLFDRVELEANQIEIKFKLTNKELNFKNNPIIKFKLSLSEDSLKTVLLSKNWSWIGARICKEILNKEKLEDVKLRNDKLLIKGYKNNMTNNQVEQINIKAEKGKIYLGNKSYNKTIQVPMENKIYIENINIENNLIKISANSSLSF